MKHLKSYFVLLISLFIVGVQNSQADDLHYDMKAFLKSKDSLPYRTICKLARPGCEFINGKIFDLRGDENNVLNEVDLAIYTDDVTLHIGLRIEKNRFVEIKDLSNTANWAVSSHLESFINEMVKMFSQDKIKWIERKIGVPLNEMDAKQLCLASLTLQLWTF